MTMSDAAQSWQVCFSAPLEVEAHVVRGYLEHHGIPCHIRNNRFGLEPLTFGALGEVQVLVPPDWAKVARGLIRGRLSERRRRRARTSLTAVTMEDV